jgi:hypothetical protein
MYRSDLAWLNGYPRVRWVSIYGAATVGNILAITCFNPSLRSLDRALA